MSPDGTEADPPPRRVLRWTLRLVTALGGLAVGLAIAELSFAARDDYAFPHVNVYMPDEKLGVRLEPGSHTRLRFGGNPTTTIYVNAQGFRGIGLPPPAEDEILVVGDSQVFGLGVEDRETFSYVLGELTGRTTINAGVPTYGPVEYTEVVREVLQTRTPRTVVYAVNMANDFFEHSRPNRERHAVWDGWAVRAETHPGEVAWWPGRHWMFQRSHLFYALRRRWYEDDALVRVVRQTGFPSEGTLGDLVASGEQLSAAMEDAAAAQASELEERRQRIRELRAAIRRADRAVDRRVHTTVEELDAFQLLAYRAARGHPGDILAEGDAEDARTIPVTASLLNRGVRLRAQLLAEQAEEDEELGTLLERAEELRVERERERARWVSEPFVASVLEARLEEVRALCEAHGAELIVVAIPLDVVVSPEEFTKYGAEPVDMTASTLLLRDLVETAERMGVRALDATSALRSAQPGAFLDRDIHMSPSGHRAVGVAIAARLEAPHALRRPDPGLPSGRTRLPEPDDFVHTPTLAVRRAPRAKCSAQVVREWLRVSCRRRGERHVPTGVEVIEGGHGEAMTLVTEAAATLVVPIMEGDTLIADFHWESRTQRFELRWPEAAAAPEMAFGRRLPARQPTLEIDPRAAELCACHIEAHGFQRCRGSVDDAVCTPSCDELYGAVREDCFAEYSDNCRALLRCARGDPARLPPCPEGTFPALPAARCVAVCAPATEVDPAVPCTHGECIPWQGTHVCR